MGPGTGREKGGHGGLHSAAPGISGLSARGSCRYAAAKEACWEETMTELSRRTLLAGLAAAPFATAARAQGAYPTRPVRVLVPYPPAGGADTTARILFATLSEALKQQFVIENRGGAGGTIGEAVVAKAEPDGYTLLHDATGFSVNGALYQNLTFDYRRDFTPVFLASLVPNILICTPSVPVKTVADVIAYAKAQPNGIDMASSGNGTLQHLSLELFRRAAGIKINHVPYRGGGVALNDVISGQVKFFFANGSSVVGQIAGGQVKAIAHTGKGKLDSLPNIPAVSDTLPGFEAYEWNGVFGPRGMPAPIVKTLNAKLNETLKTPTVSQRFKQLNIDARPNTPEEFAAFVDEQMEKWGKVVKEANIKLG
jgi:tripartite-type tricarboxylate transporter receptor subunit TctC